MDPKVIGIIVVVVLVLIVAAIMISRKREAERLRKAFGTEYDREVEAAGSRSKAEAELHKREKRVEKLDIRPLPPKQRETFLSEWQEVQTRFVDDPRKSIALADALVGEVMKARGYPVDDFEQRAAEVRHRQGKAGTEDLRAAFIGYRSIFEELLGTPAEEPVH